MSNYKKYVMFICKDCEIDFLVNGDKRKGRLYCPSCGEGLMVENVKDVWFDRGVVYKSYWSEEEDSILIMGCEAGYSFQEIVAAVEGRSAEGVRNRLKRLRDRGLV